MKPKGWRNESRRHSLSAKGIKTAQKIPKMPIQKMSWENKIDSVKTKDDARQVGIDFQIWVGEQNLSYGELIFYQNKLYQMAKRFGFGLVREFKENGLI